MNKNYGFDFCFLQISTIHNMRTLQGSYLIETPKQVRMKLNLQIYFQQCKHIDKSKLET